MNEVSTFTFPVTGQTIRVVELEGNPWFVTGDVCRALGVYLRSDGGINTNAALEKLNADERRNLPYVEAKKIGLQLIASRGWGVSIISESALYKVVLRAHPDRDPAVRKFQDWVTREVLPAIRKDGLYVMGEEKVRSGEMSEDEMTLLVLERLTKKVERLRLERDEERVANSFGHGVGFSWPRHAAPSKFTSAPNALPLYPTSEHQAAL